jgi:hypothetical protein
MSRGPFTVLYICHVCVQWRHDPSARSKMVNATNLKVMMNRKALNPKTLRLPDTMNLNTSDTIASNFPSEAHQLRAPLCLLVSIHWRAFQQNHLALQLRILKIVMKFEHKWHHSQQFPKWGSSIMGTSLPPCIHSLKGISAEPLSLTTTDFKDCDEIWTQVTP